MKKKPFYTSKLIGLALLGLGFAVVEHVFGPDARFSAEAVWDTAMPLLVIIFRTYFTSTTIA